MRISSVNSTRIGGAAIVVTRLNKVLEKNGVSVNKISMGDGLIDRILMTSSIAEQMIGQALDKDNNNILHSFSVVSSNEFLFNNQKESSSLIHLHWINGGLMKPEDFLRINKPMVWTMHDMWPMCGAEHHAADKRYIEGYLENNRPIRERGLDLNRWVWERKRKVYEKMENIVFIAPSKWLFGCAKNSYLLKDKNIVYIPNGVDTVVFRPESKSECKKHYGINVEMKTVLIGAAYAIGDKNKQLNIADEIINGLNADVRVLMLGRGDLEQVEKQFPKSHDRIVHLGYVDSEEDMRRVYGAADIFMMLSKHENLPNMVMESMACGTPVIAFDVGGIGDMVEHRKNGLLIEPFDVEEYTNELQNFLNGVYNTKSMSMMAVNKIKEYFDITDVARKYRDVYRDLVG